jgi:saccharopine dehydrogenase-like NADP-dependent oxidoreductase
LLRDSLASNMISEAKALTASHENAKAIQLDANNSHSLGSLIEEADVVVRLVQLLFPQ